MSFQLWLSISCKFSPRHPYLSRQLPRDLLMLSSAIIFRRSALDKKIATRIEQALTHGVELDAVTDDIREYHLLVFQDVLAGLQEILLACDLNYSKLRATFGTIGLSPERTCASRAQ